MRRLLVLTIALAAATVPALAASSRNVSIPPVVKSQVAALHAKGIGPILLPETMPTDSRHLYASLESASSAGYSIALGAVRGCHEATACFEAAFLSHKSQPTNQIHVKLTGGRTGYYRDIHCGASCAPASIEFRDSGFTYEIQANVVPLKHQTTESSLIAMANSALTHGAR